MCTWLAMYAILIALVTCGICFYLTTKSYNMFNRIILGYNKEYIRIEDKNNTLRDENKRLQQMIDDMIYNKIEAAKTMRG